MIDFLLQPLVIALAHRVKRAETLREMENDIPF